MQKRTATAAGVSTIAMFRFFEALQRYIERVGWKRRDGVSKEI